MTSVTRRANSGSSLVIAVMSGEDYGVPIGLAIARTGVHDEESSKQAGTLVKMNVL